MKVAVHEDPEVLRMMRAPLDAQRAILEGWGIPDTGVLILMSPCDGQCFFCAQPEVTHMPEAMITRWEQVTAWLEGATVPRRLLLGGTEPTSHPRFEDSLRLTAAAGFTEVELMTSGVRLAVPGVAARWRALGVATVCVPLYAATPAEHDAIVRVPDHWDRVTAGLDRARDAGIAVAVHTLALRRTLPLFADLARMVHARWDTRLVVAPLREKDALFRYADEAPPYAAVAAAVAGLDVRLAGFPACVAPDVQRGAPDVIGTYFRGQRTVHLPSVCDPCARRAGCPGAVPAHLTTFGETELTPIRGPQRG